MNSHKKGLKRLLDAILRGEVGRLVITHKDRLLRFGAELVFAICEAKGVEVVIHDRDVNAAINLKNMAVSSTVSACGEEGSGLTRKHQVKPTSVKQEVSVVPV